MIDTREEVRTANGVMITNEMCVDAQDISLAEVLTKELGDEEWVVMTDEDGMVYLQ